MQGTFPPVGAQGGSMEPPKKTNFLPEFCNEICTIYVRTIQNHDSAKLFFFTVSKWWPNNQFLFRVISILAKIWGKKHFLKGIFQWN